jgi:ElaB/YqjD/DUF883 family membrane-anchored ribosome-binding protein
VADTEDMTREATRGVSGSMGAASEKAKDAAQAGSEWATHMVGAAGDKVRGAADKTEQAGGIAEKAKGTTDHASECVNQATEAIADMASGAGDATQRMREQANRVGANIGRRAQEQPLAAFLVAGTVGYVLAYLLHGRR